MDGLYLKETLLLVLLRGRGRIIVKDDEFNFELDAINGRLIGSTERRYKNNS